MNTQAIEFEKTCQRLVGLELQRVVYEELAYDQHANISPAQPYYITHFPQVHSLDYSVWLYSTQQDKVELTWGNSFVSYGIEVKINQLPSTTNSQKWEVSTDKLWQNLIGLTIQKAYIHWDKLGQEVYPQTLVLEFANQQTILISAAQFLDETSQKVYGFSDNLIVTNDMVLAKTIGLLGLS